MSNLFVMSFGTLDMWRAFDTLSYVHVLQQLVELNVRGRVPRTLAPGIFCKGEIFVFASLGEINRHKPSNGVPKGSFISPTFFNIVISPLPGRLLPSITLSLYADDICMRILGRQCDDLQKLAQSAIYESNKFLNQGWMKIAPEKSCIFPFTRKKC